MPVHLLPREVSADLEGFRSVLVVSCPVCPPMCLAMERKSPFIELFKRGLRTGAFEDYIQSIREPLEKRGVRTGVYSIYTPCPMMCLWTTSQQNRLRKRAGNYEAVLVLGCDSATYTAQRALESTDCQVIQGMRMMGAANATVKVRFPLTVDLEMHPLPGNGSAGRQKPDAGGSKAIKKRAP
ncbi:MAG TPA: hypothetical protein VLS27_16610 [Gammaproteobacteria bacterium]|nr:hypothetical protein [Gammaproteobacteria bacterium]